MLIVDSQIHIWENGKMSPHHRQIPTYGIDDALAEMKSAGVDAAVIHPPSSLGEAANELAVKAVKLHPEKFCILGHFDLQSAESRGHRQALARAAGHARVPLHLQRAAPEDVVDRRLARLVLEGVREGEPAGRSPRQREEHRGIREDRRAASGSQDAHRSHRTRRRQGRRQGRRGLCRPSGDARARQITQCRGQALGRAEHVEPSPIRTRTSTSTCNRSSRRSGPTAVSGAPTSRACRARIGSA